MHYEVEQAGLGREPGPAVGTHTEPERWHVVRVFNADAVPMPLRFDTLEQALAYPPRCRTAPGRGGHGYRRAHAGGSGQVVRRVAQAPAHYEVKLRQPAPRDGRGEAGVKRVGPDGTMQPLGFATLQAANTHAERLRPKEARIVAVESDGWCWVVDNGEA